MPPTQQDAILAAVLTVGMLIESGLQLDHSPRPALTLALDLVMGGTLAARRRAPALATAVAVAALGVFVRFAEIPDWTVPLLVIAAQFFTVGLVVNGRRRLMATASVLLAGLVGVLIVDPEDVTAGVIAILANAALFGLLPLAVGRTLRNRRVLTRELRTRSEELERDRDERTRRAAVEERTRIARELHDVVAHSVSVMVIQAQAAQRVAAADRPSARDALAAIEISGREALAEMRRMIGVMRTADAGLDGAAPGLSLLPALVDRARAAGLTVDVRLDGEMPTLAPGVDLVAYRFVQEGLTNVIKHAGPAHATVTVRPAQDALELEVSDNGRGGDQASPGGSGQGIIGMRERLALYGGQLDVGRRPQGGFRVRARIPLSAADPTPVAAPPPQPPSQPRRRMRSRLRHSRWTEPVFVATVTAISAVSLLRASHGHGGVVPRLLMASLIGSCVALRRRNPLLYATATISLAVICTAAFADIRQFPLAMYIVLVPPYVVAAYEDLPRAVAGLTVLIAGSAAVNVLATRPATPGDFVFPITVFTCAWAVGRTLRAGRALTIRLARTNERLAVEREHRARLAVADERNRIARELQLVVASSVSDMVVEAELARRLLDDDAAQAAVVAMGTLEATGRAALAEMRRILQVLRGPEEARLEPQPGLGALPLLLEQARVHGRQVELTVHGEPGPLPSSVELAAYRVVEEALARSDVVAATPEDTLQIVLEFRPTDLLLVITDSAGRRPPATVRMRERVTACNGELFDGPGADGAQELRITLPTGNYLAVLS